MSVEDNFTVFDDTKVFIQSGMSCHSLSPELDEISSDSVIIYGNKKEKTNKELINDLISKYLRDLLNDDEQINEKVKAIIELSQLLKNFN